MAVPANLLLSTIWPGKSPVDRFLFFFFGLLAGPFARWLHDYFINDIDARRLQSTFTSDLNGYQWSVDSLLNTTSPIYLRAAPFVPGRRLGKEQLVAFATFVCSHFTIFIHAQQTLTFC
jgi:hypothetical protein